MPAAIDGDAQAAHARLLCDSYRRWTGRRLITDDVEDRVLALRLFSAPFALVSHGLQDDPIFDYGNATALRLFEMDWNSFTRLPSRLSAQAPNREERAELLARVTAQGFIDDYRGVRIAASGRRFVIDGATVWNLVDAAGRYRGQAARFDRWRDT